MYYKIFVLAFILFAPFALSAQKEISGWVEVKKVGANARLDGHQVFYSLPKNNVIVTFKITKTTMVKGPYADFALKQLNINSGIIGADAVEYTLNNVKIISTSIADSSQRYAITYSGFDNLPELQLNEDGTLLGCNCSNPLEVNIPIVQTGNYAEIEEELPFFDLGTHPFFKEEEIEAAGDDSTNTKKQHRLSLTPKTTEENAADAAAFIRKIRKRRLKLLVSMYQESNAVDGAAVRIMVDELEKLEKSYIELFTGKTITKQYEANLVFTPGEGMETEQATIGWFSKSQGLIAQKQDIRRNDSKPIVIKIEPLTEKMQVTLQTIDNTAKNPTAIKYGLYYRQAAPTVVSLECSELFSIKQNMVIAQKGIALPLPSEYLLGRRYCIVFDGSSGALSKIGFNKE